MRNILAIALIVVSAAAQAQSYEDRAATERAQQVIEAYDKAKMDEARAAQAPKRVAEAPAQRDPLLDAALLVAVAGVGAFLWFRKPSKKAS